MCDISVKERPTTTGCKVPMFEGRRSMREGVGIARGAFLWRCSSLSSL